MTERPRPGRTSSRARDGGPVLLAVEREAATDAAVGQLLDELRRDHEVVEPPIERALGRPPTSRALLVIPVTTEQDAEHAVRAALGGFSVLVIARGDRALMDRLYDDLRRFGRLVVRSEAARGPSDVLRADELALLELLARGLTLGDAAKALHLSRRTADRRLAKARLAMGAATTPEAIALLRATPHG